MSTNEEFPSFELDGSPQETTIEHEKDVLSPEEAVQPFKKAVVSIEWLHDLKRTISNEGVSQLDMAVVADIRKQFAEDGFETIIKPALENYTPKAFTIDRSLVNVEVAVETITQTIASVVRAIIRKLTEYVRNMVRWYQKTFKNEAQAQVKLDLRSKTINSMRSDIEKIVNLNKNIDPSIHREWNIKAIRIQNELFSSVRFPMSEITLGMLGDRGAQAKFTDIRSRITESTKQASKLASELNKFINGADTVDIDLTFVDILAQNKESLIQLDANVHNLDKRLVAITSSSNAILLDNPLSPFLTVVTPFDFVVKTYQDILDTVNKIKISNSDDLDTNQLAVISNILVRAVDDYAAIVRMYNAVNDRRSSLLNVYYMYINNKFSYYYNYHKSAGLDKMIDAELEKIKSRLIEFARQLM